MFCISLEEELQKDRPIVKRYFRGK